MALCGGETPSFSNNGGLCDSSPPTVWKVNAIRASSHQSCPKQSFHDTKGHSITRKVSHLPILVWQHQAFGANSLKTHACRCRNALTPADVPESLRPRTSKAGATLGRFSAPMGRSVTVDDVVAATKSRVPGEKPGNSRVHVSCRERGADARPPSRRSAFRPRPQDERQREHL